MGKFRHSGTGSCQRPHSRLPILPGLLVSSILLGCPANALPRPNVPSFKKLNKPFPVFSPPDVKCAISGSTLTYHYKGPSHTVKSFKPDSDISKFGRVTGLICSSDFTVIFTSTDAIVTLGYDAALQREMLGFMKDKLRVTNSYSLPTRSLFPKGITKSAMKGNVLVLKDPDGQAWAIDLWNPVICVPIDGDI